MEHAAPPDRPSLVASLKTLRRARAVARFNGFSALLLAAPALLFGLFSLTSLIVGVVLAGFGARELRLGRRLGGLDPDAPRALAVNQLALLAGVLLYCAWQTWTGLTGPTLGERHPELRDMAADIDGLSRTLTVAVYATVAALSLVFQGLNAWYYASRRPHVAALREAGDRFALTPAEAAAA